MTSHQLRERANAELAKLNNLVFMNRIVQHPKSLQFHIVNSEGKYLSGYPGDDSFQGNLFGAFSAHDYDTAASRLQKLETVSGPGWIYTPYPQPEPMKF